MYKKISAALVIIGLAGVLSACSGGDATSPTADATAAKTVTTAKAANGKEVASNPGKGIISATKMNSCGTVAGPVTAAGTVTPPANAPGKVVVSVSWVNTKTSAVIAKGEQTFDAPEADKPIDWSIEATLPKDIKDVECVLGATVLS